MKRTIDLLLAALALLILSPLLASTAVAILLETGRPVLFRQVRLGLGGKAFEMFKFRSMVADAAVRGSWQTAAADPRITRVGRVIRRLSIDELPQLFNVLIGQMSLVGPRPDVPAQRILYADVDWAERCRVRPGLTGLAQAKLRSEGSKQQRLDLDLRYVREHNLWLDAQILWWTLGRLTGKGSN